MAAANNEHESKPSPLKEITQPFIDLIHAPRALWGINLAYVLEGMVYFGMLGYLAIHFSDFVFQGVEHADEWSHSSVMVLTAGITISMFFLGFIADKYGVRRALLTAFCLMLVGRIIMSAAPNLLGADPVRPGVQVGDTVSLHVTKLATRDGIKAISKATLIANDEAGRDVGPQFAIDLAAGAGTVPGANIESRLVQLGRATLLEGERQDWQIEYGSGSVQARLISHAASSLDLCEGAVVSIDEAYVTLRDDDFVIRTHWAEDFASVDRSGCAADREVSDEDADDEQLRTDERWAIEDGGDGAAATTIAALRGTDDGKVDLVLKDAVVTYVRNGGYYLQAAPEGPAIFAFVSPLFSPLHLLTMLGILFVLIGYGMYQPAAYAGVRQFTTPKTAAMGFAMLYALMNLGGWLPTFAFLVRDNDYLGLGIPGTYWVYTCFTAVALVATFFILSRKTVAAAIARAKEETKTIEAEEKAAKAEADEPAKAEGDEPAKVEEEKPAADKAAALIDARVPKHMWCIALAIIGIVLWKAWGPVGWGIAGGVAVLGVVVGVLPGPRRFLANHPLANAKFAFFIFCLIPVQTLFVYNWMVLPQYISRAFDGWLGDYFEITANANPILIFIAVPIIAALSTKAKVYNMMIWGTLIMAAPAFLLVIGPYWWTIFPYIFIMTIGEAMWQPRFLQYAAEIAPEGRTGEYMGVAQLPWFLTKVLVPLLYSGWMMDRYCPAEGPQNTQLMWLIFACIAMTSTLMLVLAKRWVGKDFKTKA